MKKRKKSFRTYYKSKDRNPAIMLLEDESKGYGEGFVITHNPRKTHDSYHQLHINPKKGDSDPSFMVHSLKKGVFGPNKDFSDHRLTGYELSSVDSREIDLIYAAKKAGLPWDFYLKKEKPPLPGKPHGGTQITGQRKNDKPARPKKARKKMISRPPLKRKKPRKRPKNKK